MTSKVTSAEVEALFASVVTGKAPPVPLDPTSDYEKHWSGIIGYDVDGWELWIFWDVGDFDYVDHAVAPDGRRGEFSDWFDSDGHTPADRFAARCPAAFTLMTDRIEAARPRK